MFKFSDLKSVHLEISSFCNAKCPMCSRTRNQEIPRINWTISEYQKIMIPSVIAQLTQIIFCGNFGDPLMNNDLLDMIRYTKESNSNIDIKIHTNGSLRNEKWFADLAEALPERYTMHFSIDGLEDTNHLYRVNTNFDRIISNAKAFIAAGGKATWDFIKFKHNEHQEEQIREYARELGFVDFILKNTARFYGNNKLDVMGPDGKVAYSLEPPSDSKFKFLTQEQITEFPKFAKTAKVSCYVQGIHEIFISADKTILPCCWIAAIPGTAYTSNINREVIKTLHDEYIDLVEALGGIQKLNAIAAGGIEQVVNSEPYQRVWQQYWDETKLLTCARTCGKFPNDSKFAQPNDQQIKAGLDI